MPRRFLSAAAVVVLVATFGLAACSSSDDGGSSGGNSSKMFAQDFEPACSGNPVAGATAYDPATPGIHPLVALEGIDANPLAESYADVPAEWKIVFSDATDEYAKAQLVLCMVRTASEFIDECTGYESDGQATENVVQLYSAQYAVQMYEAATGKELGRTSFTTNPEACPVFVTFAEGETSKDWYERDDAAVVEFARPFVEV